MANLASGTTLIQQVGFTKSEISKMFRDAPAHIPHNVVARWVENTHWLLIAIKHKPPTLTFQRLPF